MVSRGSTPLPITPLPPTAQRRGKGGPKAHPGGTRKRPSGGRRGWRDSRGDGPGAPPSPAPDAAAASSAPSPQMVRKTAENGQHRPPTTNGEGPGQDGFSVTAHRAKPPLGRFCKARVNRRVVSQAVVIATGVAADGHREVLGFAVGDSEDGAFWTAFLRSLKARGLTGTQLVISDAHAGLTAAFSAVLLGAAWQRCRVTAPTTCSPSAASRWATGRRSGRPTRWNG
jgi:hypothetical protein